MRRKKGFVLTELLITVAVLVTSFTIVGVSAVEIKDNLTQTQVDAYARQIYVSAQEKITKLKTSGNNELLNGGGDLTYKPEDYNGNNTLKNIFSDNSNIDEFCDFDGAGKYVIEYDPKSGRVYGVFYSEDKLNYKNSTEDEMWRSAGKEEYSKFAKENGYHISYYGAGIVDDTISDNNNEEEEVPDEEPEDPNDNTFLGDNGFVYWEVYEDGTYGVYYVYNFEDKTAHNHDYLNYGKVVVEDGYGVSISKDSGTYMYVDRKGDIKKCIEYSASGFNNLESNTNGFADLESKDGYLYKFPKAWVDEVEDANKAYFYTRLGFWLFDEKVAVPNGLSNPEPIYANLRMAKNGIYVGKGNTNPTYNNGTIYGPLYIRSARQLYDVSLYYHLWAIGAEGIQVIQDTNIDYTKYHWSTCTITTTSAPSQYPIGTNAFNAKESKGTCMLNYNGNGYAISGLNIKAANNYSGLFSRLRDYPYRRNGNLVDSGIVKNVNITNSKLEDATYKGAIAGYVESGAKVENCSTTSGYIIGKQG